MSYNNLLNESVESEDNTLVDTSKIINNNLPYYDADIKKYFNRCNVSVNSEEYYYDNLNITKKLGSALSIPFLMSSSFINIIFIIIFLVVGISSYNSHNKNNLQSNQTSSVPKRGFFSKIGNPSIIIAIIFVLCCTSSFIRTIIGIYKAKANLNLVEKNPNSRPCYSDKEKKIIY